MWRSNKSVKQNNSNKPVPLSITPRYQEADKVLFSMWVYQILGSRSLKTGQSSARRFNDGDETYESNEGMQVSLVEEMF